MIKPQFLPDAEAEFLKEIAYYSNAREGLGIKFREAVMAAVAAQLRTQATARLLQVARAVAS